MRYETNLVTGEVTEHEDAPPSPQLPIPIPSVVSMKQARLALLEANLLPVVNDTIAAGDEASKITWDYAAEVNRNDPLVMSMKSVLGLSDAQLDDLFMLAATK
jgi:hypothetical protein